MKTKASVRAAGMMAAALVVSAGLLQAAPNVYHVRDGGIGDGSSWAKAGGNLQLGIEAVATAGGGYVWVAAGVYRPNSFPNGGILAREMHFSLRTGVEVYGGFPPAGDPGFGDRDPAAHLTVCSGDIGTPGDPRDNVFHVFYHPAGVALDLSARLDGFTIRDGTAVGVGSDQDSGAGMFNDGSSPLLVRCVFTDNLATASGGALANLRSDPHLVNCVFADNSADVGGAVVNLGSAPEIVNGLFNRNTADLGGAVFNGKGAEPLLSSCTIAGNNADTEGGGVYNDSSDPRIENTILWGNENGQVVDRDGSASVLKSCIIEGGWSGAGQDNLDTDPQFVNPKSPPGPDGIWATDDDGLRLKTASPGFDTGDDTLLPADTGDLDGDGNTTEALPLDLRGGARAIRDVDRGAYEVQVCTVTFDLGSHGTRIGGGALVQYVLEGDAAVAPLLEVEFGWLFASWDQPFDDVWGDLTVTAIYVPAFGPGDVCHIRQGGTGNGTSWDEAAGDLQAAIEVMRATGGGSVWVAAGTYRPNSHPNGGATPRQMHFSLRNEVIVLGGFPPDGHPGGDDRDPWAYPSVLSGDIGVPDDPSDNVYHVFHHPSGLELDTTAVLDGFVVTGGRADGTAPADRGAGIYNNGSSPRILRCHFTDNHATFQGGALFVANSQPGVKPLVVNCVFTGNHAENGGAVYASMAPAHFANCILTGNTATRGAAIYATASSAANSPDLHHCTIAGNAATTSGGALHIEADPLLISSILWGNTPGEIAGGGAATLHHCIIQGGWSGSGEQNIATDPQFAGPTDPAGPDGLWGTADDGLIPADISPAIDSGSNALLTIDFADLDDDGDDLERLPLDFAENARVRGGVVDRGAYEPLVPVILHVRESTAGDGYSWDDATGDLQFAIDAAAAAGNSQVWVAQGTYIPTGWPNGGSEPRAVHFSLRNGVPVLGGFPPTGVPGLAERDPTAYPTVCSGQIGTGGPLSDAWHVFYHPPSAALDATARLDGVTITRSFANGAVNPHAYGGGMFNSGCSPTLVRCIFKANRSLQQGGGLYLGNSTSEVVNCVFEGNQSPEGGGVFLYQSEARFANCVFFNNIASTTNGRGAAVHSFDSAACLFSNCTFFGNTANDCGGAFYTNSGLVGVANSILWNNTPDQADGNPRTSFDYCLLQAPVPSGTGNFVADPLFLNPAAPAGPDGIWFTADDGLRLPDYSPAVNAGSTAALLPDAADLDGDGDTDEPLPLDVLGLPRAIDGIPEAGAYETMPTGMSLAYWRSLHFSAPDRADPAKEATVWGNEADPDFDRIPNAGEYLLLLDPNAFDNPLASAGLVDYSGTPWFGFEYTKGKNRPGVSEAVKTSTTLEPGSWVGTGFLAEVIAESADHITYQVLIPLGSTRRFARLEFTVTP